MSATPDQVAAVEAVEKENAANNAEKAALWASAESSVQSRGMSERDGDRYFEAVEHQAGAAYQEVCDRSPYARLRDGDLAAVRAHRRAEEDAAVRFKHGPVSDCDVGSGYGRHAD